MKIKIQRIAKSKPQLPASSIVKKLARRITTKKNWNDLNIDRVVKLQLNSINDLIPKLNRHDKISEAKDDVYEGCKVIFAGSVKGKKLASK